MGVGVSIILTGEDRVWRHSRCHLLSIHSDVYEGGDVYVFHACMHVYRLGGGGMGLVVQDIYRVCVYAPMVSWGLLYSIHGGLRCGEK